MCIMLNMRFLTIYFFKQRPVNISERGSMPLKMAFLPKI
jgi:hypothetical protein